MTPRTGVHTSVRRGFAAALNDAARLGCETLQIFTLSPSDWPKRDHTDEEFRDFRAAREKTGLWPVVVHAPFLPNLCSANQAMYERSVRALKEDLVCAERLGAEFLVIHPGAFSPGSTLEAGVARLTAAIDEAHASVPGRVKVLIENMAGGGRRVGGPAAEIALMLGGVRDQSRIGVCFDTCHAFAAGYDLSTEQGVEAALADFARHVGLDRISVFHVNDSAGPLACHRDLHQHIGQGYIGEAGFRALFRRKEFSACPLILETPKFPAPASDLENLRRLRACLRAPVPSQEVA